MPPAPPVVAPSRDDRVVAGASGLVGGPLGRHARPATWWTPLRVLAVLAVLVGLLGYAQKLPCRDVGNWRDSFQYTRFCYSDIVPLYGVEGLSRGELPYVDHEVEYPVLLGAAMALAAEVAQTAAPGPAQSARFYDATAFLLVLGLVVTVLCTALLAGRRPYDAAIVAVSPVVVVHATTNWDLLATALAAAGLLAWSRRAPRLAGLLLGLGTATKLYPALLLVALLLLAVRAGQVRMWARAAVVAVATVAALYAVLWPLQGTYLDEDTGEVEPNLLRFVNLNRHRGADWDSLAFAARHLADAYSTWSLFLVAALLGVAVVVLVGWRWGGPWALGVGVPVVSGLLGLPLVIGYARQPGAFSYEVLNTAGVVGFCALLVAVAVLVLVAPRRPRVAQVAFLVVVAFLLPNKVWSPQYVLWLLPLAALARPRWGTLLVWQAVEVLEVVLRYLHFVHREPGEAGVAEGWFVGGVLLRDAVVVALAVLVVREVLRPDLDVVRAGGVDDPAGGPLDGARDWAALAAPQRR